MVDTTQEQHRHLKEEVRKALEHNHRDGQDFNVNQLNDDKILSHYDHQFLIREIEEMIEEGELAAQGRTGPVFHELRRTKR